MVTTAAEQDSAKMDREFVVLLMGIRINRIWKIHQWAPLLSARRKMLKEIADHPETGYLSHHQSGGISVLYWRTLEQLEYVTRPSEQDRWPAWTAFNRRVQASGGAVSLWREIYVIKPGLSEASPTGSLRAALGNVGRIDAWTTKGQSTGVASAEPIGPRSEPKPQPSHVSFG